MGKAAILFWVFAATAVHGQDIRVDRVQGTVNVHPDQPLASGDRIVTGAGHCDILVDPSASFRVQPNTEIRLTDRPDGRHRFEILHGSILYQVIDPNPASIEVGTPQVGVWPAIPGMFKIAVNAKSESAITAFQSDIEIVASRGSQWLLAGQKMLVRGTAADPEFKIVSAVSRWTRIAYLVLNSAQMVSVISTGQSSGPRVAPRLPRAGTPPKAPVPKPPATGPAKPVGPGHARPAPPITKSPASLCFL